MRCTGRSRGSWAEGARSFRQPRVIEIFGGVEIAEHLGGKAKVAELVLLDDAQIHFGEKRIDLVATEAKGGVGDLGKVAAVNRAQGLPAIGGARDGYERLRLLGLLEQELEEAWLEEGEIDGKDQVEVRLGRAQGGMNTGQRSPGQEMILNHRAKARKFVSRSDDGESGADRSREFQGMLEQRAPFPINKRLIGTHAAALAASEDKGRSVAHIPR